jgi:hypothetical protein
VSPHADDRRVPLALPAGVAVEVLKAFSRRGPRLISPQEHGNPAGWVHVPDGVRVLEEPAPPRSSAR